MSPWVLIATSATIGAAVSGILNLVGHLWGQSLERRSRRRELLLTKAIELAGKKNDRMLAVAGQSNYRKSIIEDEVFLVRTYFDDLDRLLDSGKLGRSSEERYERMLKRARESDVTKMEEEETRAQEEAVRKSVNDEGSHRRHPPPAQERGR